MDLAYHNTHVTYERKGDTLTPVRIRKEWVDKRFVAVRITELPWSDVAKPIDGGVLCSLYKDGAPWTSRNTPPVTRTELIGRGDVSEPGRGLPCLTLYPALTDAFREVSRVFVRASEIPEHILNGELPAFMASMTNREVTRYARAALNVDRSSVDRNTLPP